MSRDVVTTVVEIAGACAVVAGAGLLFGLPVALIVGGMFAIGAGYLAAR